MNLGNAASYICNLVRKTDAASIAACKDFLKQRYRMIWDTAPFTETIDFVEVACLSGTKNYSVTGVEFILGAAFVPTSGEPQTLTMVRERDLIDVSPELLAASASQGTPQYVRHLARASGVAQAAIYPTPDTSAGVFVFHGKKTFTQLSSDSIEPLIVGIEHAWLAYAQGDMLERMSQYGKAAAKFQEASAHMEGLRSIESRYNLQPMTTQ